MAQNSELHGYRGYSLLAGRGPTWITMPMGLTAGAAAGGAVVGGVLLALGLPLAPVVPIGLAGLFGIAILGSVMFCPKADWSLSRLLATGLSVGHAILFALLLASWALPVPAVVDRLLDPLTTAIPQLASFSGMAAIGTLYIAVFTVFSLFAPVSLIVFRYLSLTKAKS
jgi:hypothetical protein